MAAIAIILCDNRWHPFWVADIRAGDIYRLIVNGVPQDLRRALSTPLPIIKTGEVVRWEFASEPVPIEALNEY